MLHNMGKKDTKPTKSYLGLNEADVAIDRRKNEGKSNMEGEEQRQQNHCTSIITRWFTLHGFGPMAAQYCPSKQQPVYP